MASRAATVVVTGANGFVGSRIGEALVERGASVRAIVRRAGTAPELPGVAEVVGDFTDPCLAATLVSGAISVVTTVHPTGSDPATHEGLLDRMRCVFSPLRERSTGLWLVRQQSGRSKMDQPLDSLKSRPACVRAGCSQLRRLRGSLSSIGAGIVVVRAGPGWSIGMPLRP